MLIASGSALHGEPHQERNERLMKEQQGKSRSPAEQAPKGSGVDPQAGGGGLSDQGPGRASGTPRPSGADVHAYIGRQLRAVYDDVAKQPVPDRFLELMKQLDSKVGEG